MGMSKNWRRIMKPIVYIMGILVTNVAVSFASLAYMFFYFFREDPILATVPVVLAAPAIILQPWFVACLFLPGGFFLAPLLTTTITVIIYGY